MRPQAVGVPNRVGGLPSLEIVQSNGGLIDLNGVDKIEAEGAAAFDVYLKATH